MLRSVALLLLVIALTSSAVTTRPTSTMPPSLQTAKVESDIAPKITEEEAAKKFFSHLFNLYNDGKYEEVFDLAHARMERFLPGLYDASNTAKFRAAFAKYMNKQAAGFLEFNIGTGNLELNIADYSKRFAKLSVKEQEFLTSGIEKAMMHLKMGFPTTIADEFGKFRESFHKLSESSKTAIRTQFVAFERLDELQALLTVYSRLSGAARTLCENLPEYKACWPLREPAEYSKNGAN